MNLRPVSKDELNTSLYTIPDRSSHASLMLSRFQATPTKQNAASTPSDTIVNVKFDNSGDKVLRPRTALHAPQIVIKSSIDSFDKVFKSISSTLHDPTNTSLPLNELDDLTSQWTTNVQDQISLLCESLKTEASTYRKLAADSKRKDNFLRLLQLAMTSINIFLSTSSLADTLLRYGSISLNVGVGFCAGVEAIYRFHKRAYQYTETAVNLEGLARTLLTQLATPIADRRQPSELLLFVESTRDKILKKLIEL